jgi:hypothetical protein
MIRFEEAFMNRLVLFSMILMSAGVTTTARADFLIEPGIAYHNGTYAGTAAGDAGKITGVGLNARGAFAFPVIFAGLETAYGFGTITPDNFSGGDSTWVSLGPVVGASLPMIPLRFWATYYLLDYLTAKGSLGGTAVEILDTGTAIKLGAGYTFLPMLSVNLEYVMHSYTKAENKLTGATSDASVKSNMIALSVSIPLEI